MKEVSAVDDESRSSAQELSENAQTVEDDTQAARQPIIELEAEHTQVELSTSEAALGALRIIYSATGYDKLVRLVESLDPEKPSDASTTAVPQEPPQALIMACRIHLSAKDDEVRDLEAMCELVKSVGSRLRALDARLEANENRESQLTIRHPRLTPFAIRYHYS